MSAALPTGTGKLIPIEVLRGLAAASVLFGHVQVEVAQKSPGFAVIDLPWGTGVDVFFVISGLIMVISSQSLFGTPQGPGAFMTRRLIRVVPIYWFYTTLAVVAVFLFPGRLETMRWDPELAAASYVFLPWRRWDGEIGPLLGLGWTLNYEMFFYLLFAAVIGLRQGRALVVVLGLLVGLAVAGLFIETGPAPLVFWTRTIILEFAAGVILGWLWLRQRPAPGVWLLILSLPAAAVAHILLEAAAAERFLSRGLPATLIAFGVLWGTPPRLSAWLKPFADRVGASSYSLYLSHPFSVGLIALLWPFAMGRFDWALVAVATTAAIVGGIISHRVIELPVHDWMRRRFIRPAPVDRAPKEA